MSSLAVPLENAFNRYINANDDWSACIADHYCNLDRDALPGLRDKWAAAGRQIDRADRGLRNLGASDASFS